MDWDRLVGTQEDRDLLSLALVSEWEEPFQQAWFIPVTNSMPEYVKKGRSQLCLRRFRVGRQSAACP